MNMRNLSGYIYVWIQVILREFPFNFPLFLGKYEQKKCTFVSMDESLMFQTTAASL